MIWKGVGYVSVDQILVIAALILAIVSMIDDIRSRYEIGAAVILIALALLI